MYTSSTSRTQAVTQHHMLLPHISHIWYECEKKQQSIILLYASNNIDKSVFRTQLTIKVKI